MQVPPAETSPSPKTQRIYRLLASSLPANHYDSVPCSNGSQWGLAFLKVTYFIRLGCLHGYVASASFLLHHSSDIKVSERQGFAWLSPGGEEAEQEVVGGRFFSPLNVEAYWLLWNLCVHAEVSLSLVMGLGSAHWPPCSHGESVSRALTIPLAGRLWYGVPGDLQSAITPLLEISHWKVSSWR